MSIVCGTDFSEPSSQAVTAAARLASRMRRPLHLVHVVDLPPHAPADERRSSLVKWGENQMREEAARLTRFGVQAKWYVRVGVPDQVLLQAAGEFSAKLIVVAAVGQRPDSKWQLGSHADRLAQSSHVPTLVVRDEQAFDAWVNEERPLRIVLGGDRSTTSEHAASWVNELAQSGPCILTIAHLYWPPEQFHRLGLGGVRSYLDPDPEVTKSLQNELSARFVGVANLAKVKFRVEPHLGRLGDRLASIAVEEQADMLVIGSHSRNALTRLWEGSVSRNVLQTANISVVCVPTLAETQIGEIPKVLNVLVATDFSGTANSAIPFAYSIAEYGGTVHLVHVLKGAPHDTAEPHDILDQINASPTAHSLEHSQLLNLVPPDASQQLKRTRAYVVKSHDPALAIAQVAERLGVDVICLGTHGRKGLLKAMLGSVAEAVLGHTKRPVLFVPARSP